MENRASRRSKIDQNERYVSRSAYKLESVLGALKLDFNQRVVLDAGSSTGGFSDLALSLGAAKVIAVDKGTNQMDKFLRLNPKIELHEKTDILSYKPDEQVDIVLMDLSFISLRQILPAIHKWLPKDAIIVAMAKPQFETEDSRLKHRGVIKNERYRREILSSLEQWMKQYFLIVNKADSRIYGTKGNRERFFKLKVVSY